MSIEIDHMALSVGDYDKAKAFYTAALKPLRGGVLMEFPMDDGNKVVGLGSDGKAFLWIAAGGKATHQHIALRAETREQVDAFYAAAMAAGGTDNGAPGLRPHYHANYYAAFVLDPEGHNIECVTHTAPGAAKPARKAGAKRSSAAKKPAKRGAAKTAAKKPAKRAAAKKPTRKAAAKPAARRAAGRKAGRRSAGKKTRR